jgi:hypothetical protein
MRHANVHYAILFVLAVVFACGTNTSFLSAGENLSLIGSALLTDVVDVHFHGMRVLGATKGGIVLVDFTNPEEPELSGYLATQDVTRDVILTDAFAYAACGSQGALIVPVADSLAGEPASAILTEGKAEGIYIASPYLYVASGYGLEIFNVLDPDSPSFVSRLPLEGGPTEVWVSDTLAFVSDGQSKLWIVSVADSSAPCILGSEVTWGNPMDVVATDGVAILAEYLGIVSYDVTNPGSIVPIDTVDTPGRALDLFLESQRLYLADDVNGTHRFTVSGNGEFEYQFTFPSLVPSEDARGVSARNDTVVIGEDMTAIFMVDWGDSLSPVLVSRYDVPGYVNGASTFGDGMIAVAEGSKGLRILRMREDGRADYVSLLDLEGHVLDVEVRDTLAFLPAGLSGLHIVNIADPASPELLATVDTERDPLEVRASGQYLYVADKDFKVIDVSNPRNPDLVGNLDTPEGYSNDLFFQSPERIYVANGSEGLLIVDAGVPAEPVEIGEWSGSGPTTDVQGVWVENDLAYLAGSDSLIVLDVGDPSGIERIGAVGLDGNGLDVTVSGALAFVALQQHAVMAVDVSDPEVPLVLERYETSDMALNLSLSADTLLVADLSSLLLLRAEGLGIVEGEWNPGSTLPRASLLQNYPNPFNPHTTIVVERGSGENTLLVLRIYDVRGRLLRALPVPPGTGRISLTWDGKDKAGRAAPSGVYFYSLGSGTAARKMLLLR